MPSSDRSSNSGGIRVILVDDSAVIRGFISKILEAEPDITVVDSVENGERGIAAAERHKPDIVILDVEMPVMNGMTALPKIIQASPKTKVIMCSTLTVRNAEITLEAFKLGATDNIAKPTSSSEINQGVEFKTELVNKVRGILGCEAPPTSPSKPQDSNAAPRPAIHPGGKVTLHISDAKTYKGKPDIVAIGSSTGGPQAIFEVMSHLKNLDVPIVLTQHMPATFTKILAKHITDNTGMLAEEAEDGMPLERGKVLVAPGGFHMLLVKDEQGVKVKIDDGPPVNFCKPAVDPMIDSAIAIYDNRILGVILTGMGHDGLYSCQRLVEAGGRVVAQDEETSVVWGMPGAVATAGICTQVLPLKEIGPWVHKTVMT